MKIINPEYCEIDIRRPDGRIETVRLAKIDRMNDVLLGLAREANRAAGRGEVLRYRNFEAEIEMEESDYVCDCERCRARLDSRTAWSQQEWARFGGSRVRVAAYYCDSCRGLLQSIGGGEHTEMDERAGRVPSFEPSTKSDDDE